ncbi:MAG: hypothetical protein JWN44_625 [Myxococcales bacterium]|nr:hypothetical protein [Myxococcales bacterium]
MAAPLKVAILDTSVETIETLVWVLEQEGYATSSAMIVDFKRGADLGAFLTKHDPAVIVYDVALPYEENWRYYVDVVKRHEAARGRCFILTTTNVAALEKLVGRTGAIELVGKPFDLETIVDAVEKAARACGAL